MKSSKTRAREFGIFMGVVLSIAAVVAFRRAGLVWAVGLGTCAAVLVVLAFVAPAIVRPIADAWAAIGHLLGRITTPVLLVVVYVVVVVPLGVVSRLFGSDPLRRRRDPKAATYWIERKRRTFEPSDFERLS